MKAIDRIRKLAASVGATIDETSLRHGTIIVDAPPGYQWEPGRASIVVAAENSGQTWWRQACKEVEEEMSGGLDKCNTEEAADLEHLRDEPWTAPDGSPETLNPHL